jgi:hypothetical protein
MSHASPSRAGSLARVALALGVLNALLAHGNAWPSLWPALEWRLAVELAVAAALVGGWGAVHERVPRRLEVALAALGTLWVVLHYIDVTVPAMLGRRVNVYWDAPHLGAVLRMSGREAMMADVLLALVVAMLILALLYVIVRRCVAVLARGAEHRPGRILLLAFAGMTLALWLAPASIARLPPQSFAPTVTAMLVDQYRLLSTALSRTASAERLGPGPAFTGSLAGLDGADVLIVFAEAYGAVTLDRPEIARGLDSHRKKLADAITASGRQVVSARLVSPTFGGASWLAHASLLSGLDMRDPSDYQLLLTTRRPTLVRHFAANGYRTVGWLPGIQLPWPEGAFYGFDRYADAERIGYTSRAFGFWRIPDQASMALIHAQEFGGNFGPAPEPVFDSGRGVDSGNSGEGPLPPAVRAASEGGAVRAPRLIVFPTVTTHAPFRALPPYREDWASLLGAEAFRADEVEAAEAVPTSWSNPLPAYLASMRYQFDWLTDYLVRYAPANLVTIVIGDHQPIGSVSGPEQPWDVPVHIIARNPALLERFKSAGFVAGLYPPTTALGPTHALTPILIDAFSRTD